MRQTKATSDREQLPYLAVYVAARCNVCLECRHVGGEARVHKRVLTTEGGHEIDG